MWNAISDFRIDRINDEQGKLFYQGRLLSNKRYGIRLLKQFAVDFGYVLFVDNDCIFSETLYIRYINANLEERDLIVMGTFETPGAFYSIDAATEVIRFSFWQNDKWKLLVDPKGKFEPFKTLPLGCRRPWKFRLRSSHIELLKSELKVEINEPHL